jgi:hypothetical protein
LFPRSFSSRLWRYSLATVELYLRFVFNVRPIRSLWAADSRSCAVCTANSALEGRLWPSCTLMVSRFSRFKGLHWVPCLCSVVSVSSQIYCLLSDVYCKFSPGEKTSVVLYDQCFRGVRSWKVLLGASLLYCVATA